MKRYQNNKQLSFECADVATYKTKEKYDKAVSFWALHWLKNDKAYSQGMSNIAQVLNPGGQALISHMIGGGYEIRRDIITMLGESPWNIYSEGFEFPIHELMPVAIIQAINSANFKIEDLHITRSNKLYFESKEKYFGYYLALPLVSCIPEEGHLTFFTSVLERALEKGHAKQDSDGAITIYGGVVRMLLKKDA